MLESLNLNFFNMITREQIILISLAGIAGISIAVPISVLLDRLLKKITVLYGTSKLPVYMNTLKDLWRKNDDDLPLAIRRALALEQSKDLPEWMETWFAQVSKRVKKSGVSIPIGRYVLGMLIGGILGLTIGLTVLKNPVAAIVLGCAAFVVPDIFLIGRIQKRRMQMIEQLGVAIRIFSTEYNDTPQVARALTNTAKRIPAPLGDVLTEASRKITSGQDKDKVFAELMQELNFDYGRLFVQLLRMAWDDSSIQPMFSRLATRVTGLQKLIQENHSNMAYNRFLAMGVNALIIPAFIVISRLIPETKEFMLEHPVGRILVTLCFVSLFAGLIMDRILNGVDV